MLELNENTLTFVPSRSGGPGGQNVNKVNTRITLWFDLSVSEEFTEPQKRRIRQKLATRLDKNGRIRVVSQKHRTQKANKQAARTRLYDLLEEALKRPRARIKTRTPISVIRNRLENKKRRGLVKQQRSFKPSSDSD